MRRAILAACAALLAAGCVYKGGKVVDGTNLAIGMKIPGTEWSVSVLDYIGGIRVAGQDSTHITVTHEVAETNTYFGVVTTSRRSTLTADIDPLADGVADAKLSEGSEYGLPTARASVDLSRADGLQYDKTTGKEKAK